MKRLLVYLKDYKLQCILAPAFKMLEALFELFVPLVMASIIDDGIAAGDSTLILKNAGLLFLLAAVGLTCSVTAQYFSAKAATGFARNLKHDLFAHIESLSFGEMDRIGTSTMVTRLTADANQVQNGVNMVLRLFLRSPFIVFGAMIMAFTIDVKAALVFVAAIPLLAAVVVGITVVTMPGYKHIQGTLDKVLGLTRENLNGVRVIRAFNKEEDELDRFYDQSDKLKVMQLAVGRLSALTNPVTYVIVNAATIVIIWTGAIRVDEGAITQGQVVALVNYMSQILVELIKLTNLIVTITKSLACANRISDVLAIRPDIPVGEAATDDAAAMPEVKAEADAEAHTENSAGNPSAFISFKNVCLTYACASDESLSDITFDVNRGETVGIIGSTGSGKSSLVNLIPRFYDITAGELRIGGKRVDELDVNALRQSIGMVPQKAVLFKGSIRENMKWGNPSASDAEIWDALKTAQAYDFVKEKEGGLDYGIAQNGKNLSGGQRQRLTIARALVRRPEILILDDSASALDYATDAALRRAIAELDTDMTVFIVSQRTSSIRRADKIIVLDDGRIVGQGTHDELLENCEVYKEIYYSQYERKEEA